MTLRSGRVFKGTRMGEETFQEMWQSLLEDRRKREEEIAAERAKREEERTAREREVKEQMDMMTAHMERLMKMVEDQRAGSAAKSGAELSVKLVPLTEKDDIESYLVTFERIMAAHKVDKGRWPQ